MNEPLSEDCLLEIRKLRRETELVRKTGVAVCLLIAGICAAVAWEISWFRDNMARVLLVALVLWLLRVWLGKFFYQGARDVVAPRGAQAEIKS